MREADDKPSDLLKPRSCDVAPRKAAGLWVGQEQAELKDDSLEPRLSVERVWGRVTNRARCWREQLQLHTREQYLYVRHVESIESCTLEFLRHFCLPLTHHAQKLLRTGK